MGIQVHNVIPPDIKEFHHNIKILKSCLRGFLYQQSFYTLDEYFNYKAVVQYILTIKLICILCMKF